MGPSALLRRGWTPRDVRQSVRTLRSRLLISGASGMCISDDAEPLASDLGHARDH
jgi:hypothetical protein